MQPKRRVKLRRERMWQVEESCGAEALASVADEWRDLQTRCRDATPFQSPDWLIPWWQSFAHGELRVVMVRRDGLLCALLPLLLESHDGGRRVTLLGTGNSDHLDIIVDDHCRDVAAAIAIDAIARRLTANDWCDFEQLSASSPLMKTPAPFSFSWESEACDVCPALVLARCAGQEVLPRRRASDVRYAMRRLSRLGYVHASAVTHDTFDEVLAALFALHQARWEARHHAGVLGNDPVRTFLSAVARAFFDRGSLRLYTLRLDGRIVAVHLGFQHGRRRYYYIGGFDPELKSASVGSILLAHAITDAVREGATEFDFLRGAEAYKYQWGARDRPNYRRVLRRAVAA